MAISNFLIQCTCDVCGHDIQLYDVEKVDRVVYDGTCGACGRVGRVELFVIEPVEDSDEPVDQGPV